MALSWRRQSGPIASSTARRARSWRNATASPWSASIPAATQASTAPVETLRQQPQLGPARDDRHELDDLARVLRERGDAQHHRLADAARHAAGRRGEGLGDEERVAAGDGVQPGGVALGVARERLDRGRRERRGLDPVERGAGEGAERPAHLGPVGERVGAAGEDQAAARGGEPAREQRQQVERGVVGPVDVLDDDRGRAAGAERLQQRVEHRLARAVLQCAGERPGGRAGDVVDRAERTRDAERVACAVERAHLAPAEHRADQRGLADPGLAQHERDPALGPGPVQCAPEGGLLLLALKQLHDPVHRPYPGARRT